MADLITFQTAGRLGHQLNVACIHRHDADCATNVFHMHKDAPNFSHTVQSLIHIYEKFATVKRCINFTPMSLSLAFFNVPQDPCRFSLFHGIHTATPTVFIVQLLSDRLTLQCGNFLKMKGIWLINNMGSFINNVYVIFILILCLEICILRPPKIPPITAKCKFMKRF